MTLNLIKLDIKKLYLLVIYLTRLSEAPKDRMINAKRTGNCRDQFSGTIN
jgi:hypothetical protein